MNRCHYPNNEAERFDTSLNELEHVFLHDHKDKYGALNGVFHVKTDANPASVLQSTIYSYSTFDCLAAIDICFYLTLYDVFKLYHGDNASNVFNKVFGKERPLENRLFIGGKAPIFEKARDSVEAESYFQKQIPVTLDDLKKTPGKYMGMNMYITGHENYVKKHPQGAARGWNVVFCGLSEKHEPLFLGACSVGKPFLLTYSEFIKLLSEEYNSLPKYKEKQYISDEISKVSLLSLKTSAIDFNFQSLLAITDPDKLISQLSDKSLIIREPEEKKGDLMSLVNDENIIKKLSSFMKNPQKIIADKSFPFTNLDDSAEAHLSKRSQSNRFSSRLTHSKSMEFFPAQAKLESDSDEIEVQTHRKCKRE